MPSKPEIGFGPEVGFGEIAIQLREARFPVLIPRKAELDLLPLPRNGAHPSMDPRKRSAEVVRAGRPWESSPER